MGHKAALLAASALTALWPSFAHAQTGEPTQQDGSDVIVVTAQRRAENISDVPVSVTALGDEQLAALRVTDLSDLTTAVPNLRAISTVGEDTPIFSLRGVSMSDYSLNQSGPIATYYDEAYIGNFAEFGTAMFDLERIEVLRGPQGTLYGRNSTGGAVNLVSKKPVFENTGFLTVGYGNYDRKETTGAVNTFFGETVAARLAFTAAENDGWVDNLIGPDLNDTRNVGGRLSVLFEPGDSFDATLILSASYGNPHNYAIVAEPGPDGIGAGAYEFYRQTFPASNTKTDYFRPGLDNYTVESDYTPRRKNRTQGAILNMNWYATDDVTVTSVTSGNKAMLLVPEDTDGSPNETLSITYYDDVKQIAQDLRISYDDSDRLRLLLGVYGSREWVFNSTLQSFYTDIDTTGDGAFDGQDCLATLPVGCNVRNRFDQTKTSLALYADATYKLTPELSLRLGLRGTDDRGSLRNFNSQVSGADNVPLLNLIPGSPDLNATTGRSFHDTDLSGKVGLEYRPFADMLIFANLSRGYRGSGFNAQAFYDVSELSIAKPEVLKAAELGVKTELFEGTTQVSATTFYYDYQNQQFINVDSSNALQQLMNLPKARVYGAEIEFVASPTSNLKLSGGLGLLSSRIEEGNVSGVDVEGNQLANAPQASLSLSADWRALEGEWGSIGVHVDGVFTSRQYFDVFNNDAQSQSDYALLSGRVSYEPANLPVELAAWVKNLTDEFYYTSRIDVSGVGFNYQHVGEPRTYGVTATFRY
jgi:iron complex outermembrane recepter protein